MSMMLTKEEVVEAREAQERATAGRWRVYAETNVFSGDGHCATGLQGNDGTDYQRRNINNAEYLVLAANLLPRALNMIDNLNAEMDDLRCDAEKWRKVREEWRQGKAGEHASGEGRRLWQIIRTGETETFFISRVHKASSPYDLPRASGICWPLYM